MALIMRCWDKVKSWWYCIFFYLGVCGWVASDERVSGNLMQQCHTS